jgi:toxin YoeB
MANIKNKLNNEAQTRKVIFTQLGWEDYSYWRENDPKKFDKLNELIEAAQQSLHTGIGKPEKLSGDLKGYYSRRIDLDNRLVYTGKGGDLCIVMARHHY